MKRKATARQSRNQRSADSFVRVYRAPCQSLADKADRAPGESSLNAMTLIEVLMIIAVLMLLAVFLLPRMARPDVHRRVRGAACINNLKQIGLSFRQWALDNDDHFPVEVSTAMGGTHEFVATPEVFRHFQVLSNELTRPRVLVCPMDENRSTAADFSTGLANSNLSYFACVSATNKNPTVFLSGDRNLTNGALLPNRILELKTNSAVGWTDEIHKRQGYVGLGDGSVQPWTTSELRIGLEKSGVATNRLAIP